MSDIEPWRIVGSAALYLFIALVTHAFLWREWEVDKKFEVEQVVCGLACLVASFLWPLVMLAGVCFGLYRIADNLGRIMHDD